MRLFLLFLLNFLPSSFSVSTISYNNFFALLKTRDYVLAAAYSESCLYSRAAMPHFLDACKSLTNYYSNLECGKINIVKEQSILPLLNISSIPTFLLYERNKVKSIFKGTKTSENIINWIQNSIIQLPTPITCQELDKRESLNMGPFNFVLFMEAENFDKSLLWKFSEAASHLYDARIYQTNCTENIKREYPAVAALSSSEEIIWDEKADFRVEKLVKFMFNVRFSEVTMYKEPLFYSLLSHGESLMVLFLTDETANKEIIEEYQKASKILLNKIRMVVAFPGKDEKSSKLSNLLDLPAPEKPFIAIFSKGEYNELTKYLLNYEHVEMDQILRFFMDFSSNSLEKYFRSQRLKQPVKWRTVNLARASGVGFQEFRNSQKDLFVLFCSKSLRECGKAYDVFEDLAYELEHLKDLLFFTIESLRNEVPGTPIFKVPHFRYYQGNSLYEDPIIFPLNRPLSIESLRDFVRENISVIEGNEKSKDNKEEL